MCALVMGNKHDLLKNSGLIKKSLIHKKIYFHKCTFFIMWTNVIVCAKTPVTSGKDHHRGYNYNRVVKFWGKNHFRG